MSSTTQEPRRTWRFPPCPGYDVEGTESWLQSMAAQGFVLDEDGFFAGFACFVCGEPRQIRYRIEAAPKKGIFDEENGPDAEARSLSEEYGWRFVARRGDFDLYACEDAGQVELHTDPRVQAISMNQIRRRAFGSLVSFLLWLVLYPLILGNWMPLAVFLTLGTPVSLLGNAVVVWSIGSSAASAVHLHRLWRRLRTGQALNHHKDWRLRARRYRWSLAAYLLLLCVFLGCLLFLWNADARGDFTKPVRDYGELPFATMEDFFPGAKFEPDSSNLFESTVDFHSDWLAPQILSFHQNGTVSLADGRAVSGGLTVDYYETVAPWMARELAREYEHYDRRNNQKYYQALSLPDSLEADYARAYTAIFPTVVLVRGNQILHASFYQTSPEAEIPLEDWVRVLDQSLGQKMK